MSFWNIADNSAAALQDGVPSGMDNDQGTIRGAGTVASSSKFSSDAVNLGQSRTVTVASGVNGITGILPAGAFGGGDQVIKRVTSDIAGVANTAMKSGGSNSANRPFSVKQVAVVSSLQYSTAIRTGGWNEFSGVFSPALSVVNSGVWDQTTDSDQASDVKANNTDNAANPSAAIPGELVYQYGGGTPKQDDYAARTIF